MFDLGNIYVLNLKTEKNVLSWWICKLTYFLNQDFTVLHIHTSWNYFQEILNSRVAANSTYLANIFTNCVQDFWYYISVNICTNWVKMFSERAYIHVQYNLSIFIETQYEILKIVERSYEYYEYTRSLARAFF